jgi:FixJ family two-component response regulator
MTAGAPAIIAVVDNEPSVRKALLRLLRAAGLDVHVFASGREFLDSLAASHYDCLVLDLHMPGVSGFDVQRDPAFSHVGVPTVVITAHDEPGTRQKCLSLGAAAYLRKPVDDKELLSAIEDAISKAARTNGV